MRWSRDAQGARVSGPDRGEHRDHREHRGRRSGGGRPRAGRSRGRGPAPPGPRARRARSLVLPERSARPPGRAVPGLRGGRPRSDHRAAPTQSDQPVPRPNPRARDPGPGAGRHRDPGLAQRRPRPDLGRADLPAARAVGQQLRLLRGRRRVGGAGLGRRRMPAAAVQHDLGRLPRAPRRPEVAPGGAGHRRRSQHRRHRLRRSALLSLAVGAPPDRRRAAGDAVRLDARRRGRDLPAGVGLDRAGSLGPAGQGLPRSRSDLRLHAPALPDPRRRRRGQRRAADLRDVAARGRRGDGRRRRPRPRPSAGNQRSGRPARPSRRPTPPSTSTPRSRPAPSAPRSRSMRCARCSRCRPRSSSTSIA